MYLQMQILKLKNKFCIHLQLHHQIDIMFQLWKSTKEHAAYVGLNIKQCSKNTVNYIITTIISNGLFYVSRTFPPDISP